MTQSKQCYSKQAEIKTLLFEQGKALQIFDRNCLLTSAKRTVDLQLLRANGGQFVFVFLHRLQATSRQLLHISYERKVDSLHRNSKEQREFVWTRSMCVAFSFSEIRELKTLVTLQNTDL